MLLKKYSHIIEVKVKTGKGKQAIVEILPDKHYEVTLRSLPVANKANMELLLLLSKYFKVNLNDLHLVSGSKSKIKLIQINEHIS